MRAPCPRTLRLVLWSRRRGALSVLPVPSSPTRSVVAASLNTPRSINAAIPCINTSDGRRATTHRRRGPPHPLRAPWRPPAHSRAAVMPTTQSRDRMNRPATSAIPASHETGPPNRHRSSPTDIVANKWLAVLPPSSAQSWREPPHRRPIGRVAPSNRVLMAPSTNDFCRPRRAATMGVPPGPGRRRTARPGTVAAVITHRLAVQRMVHRRHRMTHRQHRMAHTRAGRGGRR